MPAPMTAMMPVTMAVPPMAVPIAAIVHVLGLDLDEIAHARDSAHRGGADRAPAGEGERPHHQSGEHKYQFPHVFLQFPSAISLSPFSKCEKTVTVPICLPVPCRDECAVLPVTSRIGKSIVCSAPRCRRRPRNSNGTNGRDDRALRRSPNKGRPRSGFHRPPVAARGWVGEGLDCFHHHPDPRADCGAA